MKATIASWKLWGKEQEYPVLILHCTPDEIEETKALCRLQDICKGLYGLGYQRTLAAINNPDALKDQGTSFAIDLGTLLTLVSEVATNEAKREFSVSWLRSLAVSHLPTASEKKKVDDDLRCRCGQVFSNEKKLKHHQKLCSVLAKDFGLLLRTQESLKALKETKGKSHGNKTSQGKRIREDSKTIKLQPKVSARSKGKAKRKKVSNRR